MKPKTNARRWWLLPGALLAVVAGSGLWYGSTSPGGVTELTDNTVPEAPDYSVTATARALSDADPRPPASHQTPKKQTGAAIAPSLAGTDIDGSLKASADGQLMVSLEVRDFFDYFLSAVGEVSPETAIGQIQHMAQQHLPEPAASQAMVLLDQYLAYKQASLQVLQTELDPSLQHDEAYQLQALGDALAQLKQLRQETFSREAHLAFFGQEEAYSEYTLATLAIQQRTDLTEQGKQALVEWHRNQLPEALKATEQRLQADTHQHQMRVAAMASASSPEMAGQRLSDLGLDQESADGVVNYLQQRQAFDQRFEVFREAMAKEPRSGLTGTEQQEHRERLLNQHFPDQQEQTWAKLKLLDQS